MIEILSFNDSRIAEFSTLRDRVLHDQNLVVCESEKIFRQCQFYHFPILKTLSTKEFAEKYQLKGDTNYIASKEILSSIAGFKVHFDVLFLIPKPADFPLNDLDERIIILNGLTSPENVGNITRSAAAFNINSIIIDEKSCSPFLRRSIRVSMGNIFSMKARHSLNLRSDLLALKELGYQIISTANIPQATSLLDYHPPQKCAVIIGSEGHGIDQDIINHSDIVLKININPQVAHLNAANAAAIVLSHLSLV